MDFRLLVRAGSPALAKLHQLSVVRRSANKPNDVFRQFPVFQSIRTLQRFRDVHPGFKRPGVAVPVVFA